MANSVGIIGGGQLGSLLAVAAKKLNIKTSIYSDDPHAPAVNFSDLFFYGDYDDEVKINQFLEGVDVVTFEFENIPYETLSKINKIKPVLPDPNVNRIVQNRLYGKKVYPFDTGKDFHIEIDTRNDLSKVKNYFL